MKKLLVLVLILSLIGAVLSGCAKTPVEDAVVFVGLGSVTSIAKSRDYSVDAEGKETLARAQVDTVIAAASFDQDGKVISVIIDTAQTRVDYDAEMKVASDKTAALKTKVEQGDDYGMKRVSGIGKEWHEQIAALEEWMVGKTVAEIKALKVTDGKPDIPELSSLVTITVQDYIAAVEKAYQNAVEAPGAVKLGLGHVISIGKSRDYSVAADGKETLPMAQVDTIMTAVAFDAAEKVAGLLIDNAQTRVNYDADGNVTSDKTAVLKTKVELGDDYGMKRVSGIGKEWYEQIAALETWMVGKTVAEIKALKVKEVDATHPSVPDIPELSSLVTITVQDYIAVVEEAFTNAK